MINRELKIKIYKTAECIHNAVIKDRRYLHSNSDLSFREFETRDYIASRLSDMGITLRQ